ncbi:hypothetical protein LWI29_001277 [Acer saccharum]|uniref:Uncharacterized protein n=1 Tax=Acer saccharum TaxID=4024 RepID=A0AA39ST85_ACESA|nr:hypothetical protein LWI29_001277 [Acer saccharum]
MVETIPLIKRSKVKKKKEREGKRRKRRKRLSSPPTSIAVAAKRERNKRDPRRRTSVGVVALVGIIAPLVDTIFSNRPLLFVLKANFILFLADKDPSTSLSWWPVSWDPFSLLESLVLSHLFNLEKVYNGQLGAESFHHLRIIKVEYCDELKNIFSFSTVGGLQKLQEIEVSCCANMKEIFAIGSEEDIINNEVIDEINYFNELGSITLIRLPRLISFCSRLISEGKVYTDTPFFNEKVTFPSLKKIEMSGANKLLTAFQFNMFERFSRLESLTVRNCDSLEQIFGLQGEHFEESHSHSALVTQSSVLAAVIASQAMISGSFSIIQQSLSLGYFPRVKVMHTSAKYEGQVCIPEVNYLLMFACVGFTLGFRRTTEKIGNAYVVIIGSMELAYLSSVLYKFDQGGYLPLVFVALLMTVMFVWNNVYRKKYYYELERKISSKRLKEIALDRNAYRIPGLAMFCSELVQGIPPIFKHYAANVPALHSVLVFVSKESLLIIKVPLEERFIFRRVEPKELNVFHCVARYGYTDVQNKEEEHFESMLIEKLKEFIIEDYKFHPTTTDPKKNIVEVESEDLAEQQQQQAEEDVIQEENSEEAMVREIEMVDRAWRDGVVHLLSENEVVEAEGAGILKRWMINYAYNFIKRNLRQYEKVFDHIPRKSMLKVGMTNEL